MGKTLSHVNRRWNFISIDCGFATDFVAFLNVYDISSFHSVSLSLSVWIWHLVFGLTHIHHLCHVPFNQAKTTRMTKQSNRESRYRTHKEWTRYCVGLCNLHVPLPFHLHQASANVCHTLSRDNCNNVENIDEKKRKSKNKIVAQEKGWKWWCFCCYVVVDARLTEGRLSIGAQWVCMDVCAIEDEA